MLEYIRACMKNIWEERLTTWRCEVCGKENVSDGDPSQLCSNCGTPRDFDIAAMFDDEDEG